MKNESKNNKDVERLHYEIGKQLVDEAIFIYRQTNKLTPDFCVCRCSMQRAMEQIKDHLEKGKDLKFICIAFRNVMDITSIYVNIEYIKTKMKL